MTYSLNFLEKDRQKWVFEPGLLDRFKDLLLDTKQAGCFRVELVASDEESHLGLWVRRANRRRLVVRLHELAKQVPPDEPV